MGRQNERISFIGQDIEKDKMIADIEKCLLQENEEKHFENREGFSDPFPKEI